MGLIKAWIVAQGLFPINCYLLDEMVKNESFFLKEAKSMGQKFFAMMLKKHRDL